MATGHVTTGLSALRAAVYTVTTSSVVYGTVFTPGRAVEVSLEIESSDDNIFYADNQAAESAGGVFTGGTISVTIDGALNATAGKLFGITLGGDGEVKFNDNSSVPYVGFGFIRRVMNDAATTYQPIFLPKVKFSFPTVNATTQQDEIDWQTEDLTGTLFRADNATHDWMIWGAEESTEAAAITALEAMMPSS